MKEDTTRAEEAARAPVRPSAAAPVAIGRDLVIAEVYAVLGRVLGRSRNERIIVGRLSADVADENSNSCLSVASSSGPFILCSLLKKNKRARQTDREARTMDYPTASSEQLSRPLLSEEEEEKKFDAEDEEEAITESSGTLIVPASADKDENDDAQANNDDDGQGGPAEGAADEEEDKPFTIKNEIVEMASLALPLAISFFCRMGMARYVHSCVHVLFSRKFRLGCLRVCSGDLGTLPQPKCLSRTFIPFQISALY